MKTQAPARVQMAFVGDVALAGEFIHGCRPRHEPLIYPFEPLRDCLAQSDLLFVNLEGPIGNQGRPRQGRAALLHNEPEILDWLSHFRCCVCTLANNHMMDYGTEAMLRTKEHLAKRGILFVGAGLNGQEANRELRFELNGLKIGVLTFTTDEPHVGSIIANDSRSGCSGLPEPEAACARVSALAEHVDLVIVLLHWGIEFYSFPAPQQVALGRNLVAAGAHLVVGHHPHVQQGCERIGAALVCHSLGNLLLPEMRARNGRIQFRKQVTKQFAILHAEAIPQRVVWWQIQGGRSDRKYRLIPYTGQKAERFSALMAELSERLKDPHYEEFWETYTARRTRELEREGVRDAFAKLLKTDLMTILRTISLKDLRRNILRLQGSNSRSITEKV